MKKSFLISLVLLLSINLFAQNPTATLIGGGSICNDGSTIDLTINLTGTGPWVVVYNSPISGNITANVNTSPFILPVSEEGTYTLVSITDMIEAGTVSGSATVTYIDDVLATARTTCFTEVLGGVTLANDEFQIVVTVTQGDLGTIWVQEMELRTNGIQEQLIRKILSKLILPTQIIVMAALT